MCVPHKATVKGTSAGAGGGGKLRLGPLCFCNKSKTGQSQELRMGYGWMILVGFGWSLDAWYLSLE
jgi:hypothetical protein